MRPKTQRTSSTTKSQDRVGNITYWLTVALLVGVPLAFSTAAYRMYSAPKFSLLLSGAAALVPLLTWTMMRTPNGASEMRRLLTSRHVLLVSLYLIVIVISTCWGVSPVASFFGSSYAQMGLLTRLAFFVVFISLIALVSRSEKRLSAVLWAMTLTGLAVATYAFMQFFGKDLFTQSELYTFQGEGEALLRVNSTIGNSNYLGNFLLYIAPLAAGLGLASRGSARRAGLATAILSAVAIVFSGTRGAWLGLVVAVVTLVVLLRTGDKGSERQKRKVIWRVAIVALGVVVLVAIVSVNPASRSIVLRARSLVHESTGAGRTLLWRDSMTMVKDYALIGCGPEGFRKAFLPYKSDELARLAPGNNNESSHNSFIDAAVAYGLLGGILYVGIIASSFSLFLSARRRATYRRARIVASALISSLVAVVVHNFFIFDQISTGLYFFAFAALAQIVSNNVAASTPNQIGFDTARTEAGSSSRAARLEASDAQQSIQAANGRRLMPILLVVGGALFVIAVWYSIVYMLADIEISKALASAKVGSFDGVVEHGDRATGYPDPAGDNHLLVAQCLSLYSDASSNASRSTRQLGQTALTETGRRAIKLAMLNAEQSLARTLTPDSSAVLLAYFSFQLGDSDKLFSYASEAVRIDPRFFNSRWLMAEAYLAKDDREAATREARFALHLNPYSAEARGVLKRARNVPQSSNNSNEFLAYAAQLTGAGSFEKARRVLARAIRKSGGHCPDCHSALAALYEKAGLYQEAISEWETYEREAPAQALAENTSARIDKLRGELKRIQ